ncbi:hypothetical protein EDB81DRAFT_78764 [Dactylonectria macrodidyma]|uniref:Uncharacterized protein n=1 Tax=Dactylonectria macrodidyma TaxID=307937 RepID=A0A9P9IWP0_9HYPO|nr:hypothetical protein EDB81DRAFT_78764 [Dactylonectria macrodidyma]
MLFLPHPKPEAGPFMSISSWVSLCGRSSSLAALPARNAGREEISGIRVCRAERSRQGHARTAEAEEILADGHRVMDDAQESMEHGQAMNRRRTGQGRNEVKPSIKASLPVAMQFENVPPIRPEVHQIPPQMSEQGISYMTYVRAQLPGIVLLGRTKLTLPRCQPNHVSACLSDGAALADRRGGPVVQVHICLESPPQY